MGLRSASGIFNITDSIESEAAPAPASTESGNRSIKSIDEAMADDEPKQKQLDNITTAEKITPDGGGKKQESKDGHEEESKEEGAEKKEVLDSTEDQPKKLDPLSEKHKVKVDGQEVEVSLQDLKNDYSGRQVIQKKFSEMDKKIKSWEKEKTGLTDRDNYIKQEIGEIRSDFEDTVNQYNKKGSVGKNPLGVVNDLLDKMGLDSNIFNKAVFDSMLPEVARFLDMTEDERESYHVRKENEYLKKVSKRFDDRDSTLRTQEEHQRKELSAIKQSGLTLDAFHSLKEELEEAGHEDVTHEKVLHFAQVKPSLDRAVKLVGRIGSDDSDLVKKVSEILYRFPDTKDAEILSYIDPKRQAEDALKDKREVKKPNMHAAMTPDDDNEEDGDDLRRFMRLKPKTRR